jgi:hypothetical protein
MGVAAARRIGVMARASSGPAAVIRCAQASNAALAEPGVCEGRRRPMMSSLRGCSIPKRSAPSSTRGDSVTGAQKSIGNASSPAKRSAATPTISIWRPRIVTCLPTMAGSPAKTRIHVAWLMTMTGSRPGTVVSAGVNTRPNAAGTPSIEK